MALAGRMNRIGSLALKAAGHAAFALLVEGFLVAAPAAFATGDSGVESAELSHVSELRWQNRLIIILESPSPQEDIAALRTYAAQIDERDVIWFVLDANSMATNFPKDVAHGLAGDLRDRFGEGPPVILVGKDGGVKMRAVRLEPREIFSRIDSMPMRQREMR